MAAIIDNATCWSAFTSWNAWGVRNDTASLAFPTGFSNVSSPPHPLASTLGERYTKVDGSGSHEMTFVVTYQDPNNSNPPGGAQRWAQVLTTFFQLGATNPTANALLFTFGNTIKLWQKSGTKTLMIDVNGSTADASSDGASGTDYQLEIWQVITDAAGVALTNQQFVVRLISGIGGALTTTVLINVEKPPEPVGPGANVVVGETTGRGAGFEFFFANLTKTLQDADTPWGIHRIDRLTPDGIGHLDEWPFTDATNLDESGAAPPDDGTTEETTTVETITPTTPKTSICTMSAPAYAVSADAILGLMGLARGWQTTGAKGTNSSVGVVISDGTNDEFGASMGITDAYGNAVVAFKYKPTTTTKFVHGDLAGLQFGVRASTTSPAALLQKVSALTILVLYRKDGETTPAIPTTPLQAFTMQRRRLTISPPKQQVAVIRNPFVGLLAAAVAPPASSSRRRQSGIF